MVIWYGSNRKLIQLSFYVTMYLDNFFTSVPVVVHCSFAHLRLILCELMDYSTSGFTVLLHLPAAAAKSLQSCLTLWDPIDGSPPGSPSVRFSRQEHWSGLPFPSPMRESEVSQSCPTHRDPMDCSLSGSSVHGIFQARVLEWGAIAFSTQCL